jgi:hypothetical protein
MDWWAWVALAGLTGVLALFFWPRVICPLQRERGWRALAAHTGLAYRGRRVLGVPRPGRVTGTYQGRECSLSTYRALGVEARMCFVLSLKNQAQGAMSVLWQPRAAPQVRQSQPEGLADALLAVDDLGQRLSEAAQSLWSKGYHLELSGHMLRFEQSLPAFCPYGSERYVHSLQALLDVLCDLATAIEQLPRQQAPV